MFSPRPSPSLLWGIAIFATSAAGQVQFKIGAGPSFPTGDFATEAVNGYNVQASVGFKPRFLPVAVRADYFYADFKNVERAPGINVTLGGEWFRQSGVIINGIYGLSLGPAAPYAIVGVGWIHEWHNDRSYWGTSHNTLNLNAGVGIDIPVSGRWGLFVEARQANLVGGRELPLLPPAVRSDVAFQSIPITAGVRF